MAEPRTRPPVRAWHLVVYAFMPLCGLVVLWDGVVRADTEFVALGAFFMLFGIVMLAVNAGRFRKQQQP